MPLTLNPIIMKETGQDLIKNILYLIISQWNRIFFLFWSNTNTEKSYETFLEKIESLLKTYAPVQIISKNQLKFKDKPCLTPGLQNSIFIKKQSLKKINNFILQDFIKKTLKT